MIYFRYLTCIVLFVALVFSSIANAQFQPVVASKAMVAGPEPLATQVGLEILQQGGNAFDAAAAIGFALTVTYPSAGNLGGGGFLIAHTAEGERFLLDFRETAPQAASWDMYLDEDGEQIEGRSTDTLLAVGVPGTPHGLLTILEDRGSLSREAILAPAIRLAEQGFEVPHSLHRSLKNAEERIGKFETTARIFYPDGEALAFGAHLRQPDLAATLQRIAEEGIPGFYEGVTADLLTGLMEQSDGIITHEDLKRYRSRYREPVVFSYKDFEVIAPGMPSSGGVTLGQILKLLEPLPLRPLGHNSARYVQTVVEAERLAFADRNHHLGDSDFVEVPLEQLLSKKYLDARRRLMPRFGAGRSDEIVPGRFESEETTHYCVVDEHRNVVAVTYTLNSSYGMGAVVQDAGFFLNNEMDDFTAKPGVPNQFGLVQGEANRIEPGKRMLSSMTPTIVLKDGAFAFTMGTPGGSTIITTNAQIFLNIVEFGMNIRDAIDAPRFHHQHLPDDITHESRTFSQDTIMELERMGYNLSERRGIGFACGIQATQEGWLAGH